MPGLCSSDGTTALIGCGIDFATDQPLSLEALADLVKKKLPDSIYRCKGIVYTAEYPARRVILQAVGRRTDVSLEDEWGDRGPYGDGLVLETAGGAERLEFRNGGLAQNQ